MLTHKLKIKTAACLTNVDWFSYPNRLNHVFCDTLKQKLSISLASNEKLVANHVD